MMWIVNFWPLAFFKDISSSAKSSPERSRVWNVTDNIKPPISGPPYQALYNIKPLYRDPHISPPPPPPLPFHVKPTISSTLSGPDEAMPTKTFGVKLWPTMSGPDLQYQAPDIRSSIWSDDTPYQTRTYHIKPLILDRQYKAMPHHIRPGPTISSLWSYRSSI